MDASSSSSSSYWEKTTLSRTSQWVMAQEGDAAPNRSPPEAAERKKSQTEVYALLEVSGTFSPVTEISHTLEQQHLVNTPKRRLSLDTSETVSDTTSSSPDKSPGLIQPMQTEDPLLPVSSPSLSNVPLVRTVSVSSSATLCSQSDRSLTEVLNSSQESRARTESWATAVSCTEWPTTGKRKGMEGDWNKENVPGSFNFAFPPPTSFPVSLPEVRVTLSDDYHSAEDASPFEIYSPATSSVFSPEEDPDSRDSGFSNGSSGGPTEFAEPVGLPPPRLGKVKFSVGLGSPSPAVGRRRNSDDAGFIEESEQDELLETAEATTAHPASRHLEYLEEFASDPRKCLLSKLQEPELEPPVVKLFRQQAVKRRPKFLSTPSRSFRDITNSINEDSPLSRFPPRKSGLNLVQEGVPAARTGGVKRGSEDSENDYKAPWKRTKSSADCLRPAFHAQPSSSASALQDKPKKAAPIIQRCFSESEVGRHDAEEQERLVGDESRLHALPCNRRSKVDVAKSISADTLAALLRGKYDDKISQYELVDCRYPYEYEAGHIQGAVNFHEHENVNIRYFTEHSAMFRTAVGRQKRREERRAAGLREDDTLDDVQIFVFYCEFSQERGPKMWRTLRHEDRTFNQSDYPRLFYPEIYLLEGGYKNFYAKHSELCTGGYTKMREKTQNEEMKKFRTKSRSTSNIVGEGPGRRTGLQRGLFPSSAL